MEVVVGGIRGLIQGGEDGYNQRIFMAIYLIIRRNRSLQLAKTSSTTRILTVAICQPFLAAVYLSFAGTNHYN